MDGRVFRLRKHRRRKSKKKTVKSDIVRVSKKLNINIEQKNDIQKWTKDEYKKHMEIPSPYYLDRGYSKYILNKYFIGYSKRTNRSVVPVFDDKYDNIIGMTARTCYPKCTSCGYYHDKNSECPSTLTEQMNSSKWKHSPGFNASDCLYNLWSARQKIMDTNSIILVEGPGDVWRLEEAGIKNSVAIFGVDLTEEQLVLLGSSWCTNVIICMDNDEAGIKASENLSKTLRRMYKLYFPKLIQKDLGESSVEEVKKIFSPILNSIKESI